MDSIKKLEWLRVARADLNIILYCQRASRAKAGGAAENSAARRMLYTEKFSIDLSKCACKV